MGGQTLNPLWVPCLWEERVESALLLRGPSNDRERDRRRGMAVLMTARVLTQINVLQYHVDC